jgi:hypothetical protein
VKYLKWDLTITGDESELRDLARIVRTLREATIPGEIESKYSPLQDFLIRKREEGEIKLELTLDEIEDIIQDELPPSAKKHDSFWRDRKRNIGVHIVRSGWHVQSIHRDADGDQIESIEFHHCKRRHRRNEI